jgi:hypothetical protein
MDKALLGKGYHTYHRAVTDYGMMISRVKMKNSGKTNCSATSSTMKLSRSYHGLNRGLRGDKLASSRQSYGSASVKHIL